MTKFSRFVWILLAITLLHIASLVFANEDWGYEGDTGPDNWGTLSDDYLACGQGNSQSPIDIVDATATTLAGIEFYYEPVPMAIFNNGHTIEVEYEAGSYIIYNEKQYDVLQFHFHQPSEHTINGEAFPMELHIVHRNAVSGNLAVVGILLQIGDNPDADYAPIFDNLPADPSEAEDSEIMLNVADLMPEEPGSFYTYEGSLTTPPCTEIVRWLVLAEPVTLTAEQIAAFGEIYDNNARPVQALNTRDLFSNGG